MKSSGDLRAPEKVENTIKGIQSGRGVIASPGPVISRVIELRAKPKAKQRG